MSPKAAPRPATYDDLCQVPEQLVAELIGGELFTSPRPASRHALAASALGAVIGGPFGFDRGGPGGWFILHEPELHLGGDVLVPDLAGWRRERLPEVPDVPYFTLAPDWICEILSPSTGARDRATKLTLHSRAGIGHAWLVDPALLFAIRCPNRRGSSRDTRSPVGPVPSIGDALFRAGSALPSWRAKREASRRSSGRWGEAPGARPAADRGRRRGLGRGAGEACILGADA